LRRIQTAAALARSPRDVAGEHAEYGQKIRSKAVRDRKHVQQALRPLFAAGDLTEQLKKLPGYTCTESGHDHQTGRVAPHDHRQPVRAGRTEAGRVSMKEAFYDQAATQSAQRDQA
jgi:hypothetical protein